VNDLSVCIVDQPVEEDSDTFVAPDTQELIGFVEAVWRRHRQAVVDAGQITQIEDVVKLGRRRRQLMNYSTNK